jgi:hypothetical protein
VRIVVVARFELRLFRNLGKIEEFLEVVFRRQSKKH